MKNLSLMITIAALMTCSKPAKISIHNPNLSIVSLAELPSALKESSGLEMTENDIFWSHNDHNNSAELYGLDKNGKLLHTLKFGQVSNVDWEDLAQDEIGNLYIGDVGNNDNDRKDLVIYKLSGIDLNQNNNNISIEEIRFSFDNQTEFPPNKSEYFFDVEALFSKGDFLYLFTKDRSSPFTGKTRLYRLPNTAGTHIAVFLDEFITDDKKGKGQITAADISPDGTMVALLSNEVVWLFREFVADDFFSGNMERLDLPFERQMESIVFKDNCTLYLTNEDKSKEPACLFEMMICF